MSKASDKQNNWKSIDKTAQEQNCDITTPEQSLCYPKNDFKNHPGIDKLLSYRKLKGDDKCNPSPKDPCVLDTTHMVVPSADVIRDYKSINFVTVVNDPQTASCRVLYKDNEIYQTYGNGVYATEEGAVITVEEGSYVSYLANPTDEEIAAEKEVLNAAAMADAESQLDCYISIGKHMSCPGSYVADQSSKDGLTAYWGEFKEYLKDSVNEEGNPDTWENAFNRVELTISNYLTTSLVCVYTNEKYTAYCVKPFYTKSLQSSDKTYFTDYPLDENGITAKNKINMTDMTNHNYNVTYRYDNSSKKLVPGYLSGNTWTAYSTTSQNAWFAVDVEKSLYDRTIFSDSGPSNKAAFTDFEINSILGTDYLDKITKGNHQGFSSLSPDQPVNPNRTDGKYVVEANTYFVQAKPVSNSSDRFSLDYNTAIDNATNLAKNYVKSSINCSYQNLEWTANCPEGYSIYSSAADNTTSVTVEEFKYSSSSNLAQATSLAKAEADARITSCILTNSPVYISCDLSYEDLSNPQGLPSEEKPIYHNPSVNYQIQKDGRSMDEINVFKVSEIDYGNATFLEKINQNKPIYIYLNDYDKYRAITYNCFQDETGADTVDINFEKGEGNAGNCFASGPSLPSYEIQSGYFTTTSTEDKLSDLNSRAIQLAVSSVVCQYGNMELSEVGCEDEKFAFRATGLGDSTADNTLVKMDKVCGGGPINPNEEDCSRFANDNTLWKCVVNNPAEKIEANTYFSTSPELVNTTAAKIQLASRVCLACDRVGGGGGGPSLTLNSNAKIECSTCSKGCCVFCEE